MRARWPVRREEVASRAGVSIDYYKRVQAGIVSGVSVTMLEALAGALDQVDAGRSDEARSR
jgi:transcriptional regulator with XRE-family HTH domain